MTARLVEQEMALLHPLTSLGPFVVLVNVDEMVVKIGVLLALLGLVHAGISLDRSEVNGIRTIVIPVRTATILVGGIGLIAFGLTLE